MCRRPWRAFVWEQKEPGPQPPVAPLQVVHVALRYYSLDSLVFAELNQKRASILVTAHVAGQQIPSRAY